MPRKAALVEEEDASPCLGKVISRGAARGAGANDEDVCLVNHYSSVYVCLLWKRLPESQMMERNQHMFKLCGGFSKG